MSDFVANAGQLLPEIREENVAGKKFLVAPAVFAVPGILNDEMVELAELARAAVSGNGVPITIAHPIDADGRAMSANHPTVPNIGRIYNLSAVDKLKGEAWIDIDLASMTPQGQEILRRIRAGEMMENSLGWWRDLEPSNQAGFSGIARNITLDHYAILLDEEGACSVNDGCGIPRVNSKAGCGCNQQPANNEQQVPPLGERILNKLNQVWEFISMSKEKERNALVERLAAVDTIGLDAEALAALDDNVLAALDRTTTATAVEGVEVETVIEVVEVEDEDGDDNGVLETLRKEIASLKGQVESLTNNAKAERKQRRDEYIAALVANASVPFSADELESFNDEQLETLAGKFRPGRFGGRPAPGSLSVNDDEGGYVEAPMPVWKAQA